MQNCSAHPLARRSIGNETVRVQHVFFGGAGSGGIDVEADARMVGLTHMATPTGDIERDRDEVSFLKKLDIATQLDDFS